MITKTLQTLPYRQDIDGLRAVAVLSVVCFHLFGAAVLPQGFLGVDIFFVISGFLITSIIYAEMQRGAFRFSTFYVRRIKRILPLFFFILFTGLGIAYLAYMPADYHNIWTSAIAASGFMANLFFMRGYGYFDINFEAKPFLHLWSLSVEEQFYFLFPIFLFLVLRSARLARHRYAICYALILLGTLLAFVSPKWFGLNWDVYYFPHLRFPEMLVGAVVAMKRCDGAWQKQQRAGLYTAVATIVVAVLMLMPLNMIPPCFPGLWTLLFSTAVGVVIWNGSVATGRNRWLTASPLLWIGKISYSLYLWHWLLLAIYRYFYGSVAFSWQENTCFLALCLALSALTYYGIEQPLRQRQYRFRTAFVGLYLLPASLVPLLHFLPTKPAIKDTEILLSEGPNFSFNKADRSLRLGHSTASPHVLILGDSHAGHLGICFDLLGQREGWSGKGYGAIIAPFFFEETLMTSHVDVTLTKARYAAVMQDYPLCDTIVLSAYWGDEEYHRLPNYLPMLDRTLQRLVKDGKTVVMIHSMAHVVTPRVHPYYASEQGIALPSFERTTYQGAHFQADLQRAEIVRRHVAKRFPTVRWVDWVHFLPNNLLHRGKPILADEAHYNAWGARYIADKVTQHGGLFKP